MSRLAPPSMDSTGTIVRRCRAVPTFPAASVAETTTVCAPGARVRDVIDQVRVDDTTTSLTTSSTRTFIVKHPGFDAPFVTSERPVGPH